MQNIVPAEVIMKKWGALLDHSSLPAFRDNHRKYVTARILENTEKELKSEFYASRLAGGRGGMLMEDGPTNAMGASSSDPSTGNVDIFDPVLISLIRRAAPNLIAYDVCGVQPMNAPTGLIFAFRARYTNQTGTEAFYNEPNTAFATIVDNANTLGHQMIGGYPGNTSSGTSNLAAQGIYNFGDGMSTATSEALGANTTLVFPEMAFSIEKVTVTALARALKAEYSIELAQDLKAVHGLDADNILSEMLSTELLAEINREVIRTINITAFQGALSGTVTQGRFDLDVDSNGRWSVEKYKGLMTFLDFEANEVAKATRRGRGNLIICASNVASALQNAGLLDYAPALDANKNLTIDDTGITFCGILNGRYKVFIDPYATGMYATIGFKGANAFDAGLFYCPYVPLQQVRAVNPDTMQPKLGFKTRYGIVANPFSGATWSNGVYTPINPGDGTTGQLKADSNTYYRRLLVDHLL